MAGAKSEEYINYHADTEKGSVPLQPPSPHPSRDVQEGETRSCASKWTRMGVTLDSFRRRTAEDKQHQLNESLKPRHLAMIAIGAGLGAGLFVASGSALAQGVGLMQEDEKLFFKY
jgi:amino acid permease